MQLDACKVLCPITSPAQPGFSSDYFRNREDSRVLQASRDGQRRCGGPADPSHPLLSTRPSSCCPQFTEETLPGSSWRPRGQDIQQDSGAPSLGPVCLRASLLLFGGPQSHPGLTGVGGQWVSQGQLGLPH
jgi:hypothetical protein